MRKYINITYLKYCCFLTAVFLFSLNCWSVTPDVNPRVDGEATVGDTNYMWGGSAFQILYLSNEWWVSEISTNAAPVAETDRRLMTEKAIVDLVGSMTGTVNASSIAKWDLAHTWVQGNSNGLDWVLAQTNDYKWLYQNFISQRAQWETNYNWYFYTRGSIADYDLGTNNGAQIPNWGHVTNLFNNYVASTGQVTEAERSNWNEAYGWGDHSNAGYHYISDFKSFSNSLGTVITKDYGTNTGTEIPDVNWITNFVNARVSSNTIAQALQDNWTEAYDYVHAQSNLWESYKAQSANWNDAYDWLKDTGNSKVGDLLIWKNANGWDNFAIGANGTVLKSNGTNTMPSWSPIAGGGDMLIALYDTDTNDIVDTSDAWLASVAYNITESNTSDWETASTEWLASVARNITSSDTSNWTEIYNIVSTSAWANVSASDTNNWTKTYNAFTTLTNSLGTVITKDYGTDSAKIPDVNWITNYIATKTGTNIVSDQDRSEWDTAYSWVTAGRLNWDIAYGWGNHASAGYQYQTNFEAWTNTLGTVITYDQGTDGSEIPTYDEVVSYVQSITLPEYDEITAHALQGSIDWVITNFSEEYTDQPRTNINAVCSDVEFDSRTAQNHIMYSFGHLVGEATNTCIGVYDVSTPSSPVWIGANDPANDTNYVSMSEEQNNGSGAFTKYVSGGSTNYYLWWAHYRPNTNSELFRWDASNPSNISSVSSKAFDRAAISDMKYYDNYLFAITSVSNDSSYMYNFSSINQSDGSDIDTITLTTSNTDFYDEMEIDYATEKAYCWTSQSSESNDVSATYISVIDISSPASLSEEAYFTVGDNMSEEGQLGVYNGKVFVPTLTGVRYFNCGNISNILDKGVVMDHSLTFYYIKVWKKMLFGACGVGTYAYDVRQPLDWVKIGDHGAAWGAGYRINIETNNEILGVPEDRMYLGIFDIDSESQRSPLYIEKAQIYKLTGLPTTTNGLDTDCVWSSNGVLRVVQ